MPISLFLSLRFLFFPYCNREGLFVKQAEQGSLAWHIRRFATEVPPMQEGVFGMIVFDVFLRFVAGIYVCVMVCKDVRVYAAKSLDKMLCYATLPSKEGKEEKKSKECVRSALDHSPCNARSLAVLCNAMPCFVKGHHSSVPCLPHLLWPSVFSVACHSLCHSNPLPISNRWLRTFSNRALLVFTPRISSPKKCMKMCLSHRVNPS